MIKIQKSEQRGRTSLDWLNAKHSFSFGEYFNSDWLEFATLRVINEDVISPSQGFGTHPHNNMEIITYIIKGELAHKDSMGNGSTIKAGNIQRMSAGSGIFHSEYNPSDTEETHLLQIWIRTNKKDIEPSYEEKEFSEINRDNQLLLAVSIDGRDGSMTVNQDVDIYLGKINDNKTQIKHAIKQGRDVWVQMISGTANINGNVINAGDGIGIVDEELLSITDSKDADFIMFDMAKKKTIS
ncbi:MAG: pirin family protein [Alphaproteobacteria bacterium]